MRILSWLLLFYQVLIILLTLNSTITFGHGLGDLGIILVYGIIILFLGIFNIIAIKKDSQDDSKTPLYLSITFCSIAAIVLTYYFTIGRGPEYPWNGKVFYSLSDLKKFLLN
jgi:hypothetical protein